MSGIGSVYSKLVTYGSRISNFEDLPFFVFGDQVVFDYVLCSLLVLYNVYHVMVSCMGALCCN